MTIKGRRDPDAPGSYPVPKISNSAKLSQSLEGAPVELELELEEELESDLPPDELPEAVSALADFL